MNFKFILYVLIFMGLLGCNNGPEPVQSYNLPPGGIGSFQKPAAVVKTAMPVNDRNKLLFNPPHGQPGHDCSIAVGAPLRTAQGATQQQMTPQQTIRQQMVQQQVAQQQAAEQAGAKGLNPAHGQPGHRCDIPVGAPLNSKPAQPTSAVTAAQQAAVQAVAKGLNPAHGQPSHRCDIAVGAPLNSKPETPASAVTAPQQAAAPIAAGEVEAKNGIKLNPPHGQPDHRCDIAVGAPLT